MIAEGDDDARQKASQFISSIARKSSKHYTGDNHQVVLVSKTGFIVEVMCRERDTADRLSPILYSESFDSKRKVDKAMLRRAITDIKWFAARIKRTLDSADLNDIVEQA